MSEPLCLADSEVLTDSKDNDKHQFWQEAIAMQQSSGLMGENNLFKCRKGLDLNWLFNNDIIISARSLTDDAQCRALALLILYTRYQQSRNLPSTSKLKHLIVIDDSSRFVGNISHQQNADLITPSYGHILATLRSSGTGVCCISQLPGHMNNTFLGLSRSMIAIGAMTGGKHLDIIRQFMQLNNEQTIALTRLSKREAIAFSPFTDYKDILHGWVTNVDDPDTNLSEDLYHNDLGNTQWSCLETENKPNQPDQQKQSQSDMPQLQRESQFDKLSNFDDNTKKLLLDCATSMFNFTMTRIRRLNMTFAGFESAKLQAVNAGMLTESKAGKALFLIPTVKLFETIKILPPYKRNVSLEHSFYCLLFRHIFKFDNSVKKISLEFPIGKSGSTGDLLTVSESGIMTAYEITLSMSNLFDNILKYKDTQIHKVVLLCRTSPIAKAVSKHVKANHKFDSMVTDRVEVKFFGQVFKNYRKKVQL